MLDLNFLSSPYFRNRTTNAIQAIYAGRKEEERRLLPEIKTRLDSLLQTEGLPIWQTESEMIQINQLKQELDNILSIGDRD